MGKVIKFDPNRRKKKPVVKPSREIIEAIEELITSCATEMGIPAHDLTRGVDKEYVGDLITSEHARNFGHSYSEPSHRHSSRHWLDLVVGNIDAGIGMYGDLELEDREFESVWSEENINELAEDFFEYQKPLGDKINIREFLYFVYNKRGKWYRQRDVMACAEFREILWPR